MLCYISVGEFKLTLIYFGTHFDFNTCFDGDDKPICSLYQSCHFYIYIFGEFQ